MRTSEKPSSTQSVHKKEPRPRLPMRFALITRSGFVELANAAGLVPVALYGDYHRGEYLEDSSPFMIWILEKARRPWSLSGNRYP
jgi:hypothetical protein